MEFSLHINEQEAEKVRQYISEERFRQALKKTLLKAGLELEGKIVQNIAERATNTGALGQSWTVQEQEDSVIVFSNLLYAPFVERGTKPHRPPFEAIRKWVKLKFGKTGKELTRTSWAVWQKITKKGTEAKKYVGDAIEDFNFSKWVSALVREWENA